VTSALVIIQQYRFQLCVRNSRPGNRLSAMVSAGDKARFWYTASIPAARPLDAASE
jgi:hypothetical protein